MRKAIQGLYVDQKGLNMVKEKISQGHKVILMPLYKSFLDYFVLNYIN